MIVAVLGWPLSTQTLVLYCINFIFPKNRNKICFIKILALSNLLVCTPTQADLNNPNRVNNDSAPSVKLNAITVFSNSTFTPLSPSIQFAQDLLLQWPGSVSLISESESTEGVVLGLSDVFAHEPGVYARSNAGPQSVKLSIRGSGLASPLGVRGITLLRDGLPLNRTDGTIDPSYTDPFNARYIEIYRGSNALQYGAATLGGAINIVSPTGYSHPGLETHIEGGSYGHLRMQTRAGEVFENGVDAFASISHYQMNGSAQHSNQKSTRFYGNLGVMSDLRSEGRFHIDLANMHQEISSPLTLSQLQGRTSLDNPSPLWPDHRIRTHPHARLAYQHSISYGKEDLILLGAHHSDTTFGLLGTIVPIDYWARDYGLSIRGEINRQFRGRNNHFTWGAHLAKGQSNSQTYGPFTLPGGKLLDPSPQQYEAIKTSAQTTQFYLENTYALTPTLSVMTAIQAITAKRQRKITVFNNPQGLPYYFKNVDHSKRYNGVNPKLGLLWQTDEHTQLYANLSRSYEPPTELEFYHSHGTTSAQKATTLEIGSRGFDKQINWEAALFHSRVKDELLSIPKFGPLGEIVGYEGGNIPETRRSGIELRLYGKLSPDNLLGFINWRLGYTFNQFYHVNDNTFSNNRLPVIPVHYGNIQATYQHSSGVYFGPDIEFASSVYADQANTLKAPGYGIVNFTLGYTRPSNNYHIFLTARNLADKRYIASTQYLAQARPNEAAFNPGLGRSIFVGAKILW